MGEVRNWTPNDIGVSDYYLDLNLDWVGVLYLGNNGECKYKYKTFEEYYNAVFNPYRKKI